MSYDLYFARRNGGQVSAEDFQSYFGSRENYDVSNEEAVYHNEDTGVYFCFDLVKTGGPAEELEEDPFPAVASLNLNYFRPHYFGLEALPEIEAFVKQFDLVVDDPQMEGMGRGEFTPAGFLSGWNAGNLFGYSAFIRAPGVKLDAPIPYPTETLEAIWRWNKSRNERQAQIGDDTFVPKISFCNIEGKAVSMAVWTDAMSVLLPHVDGVLVFRHELAPRKFFIRRDDFVYVPWSELLPVLSCFPVVDDPLKHTQLIYPRPPKSMVSFIQGLKPGRQVQMIHNDQVLNAEILEAAAWNGESVETITFE